VNNVVDWANANLGFVTLLYALITLVMVVVLAIANVITRRTLHLHSKPCLNGDVRMGEDGLVHLYIKNDSHSGAYDIKLKRVTGKTSVALVDRSYLPPNKVLDIPLGNLASFSSTPEEELRLVFCFKSELGKEFRAEQRFSVRQFDRVNSNENL
jgi:hypothetical protein